MVLAVLLGEPMAARARLPQQRGARRRRGGCGRGVDRRWGRLPEVVSAVEARSCGCAACETKAKSLALLSERRRWDATCKDRYPSHRVRVVLLERYAVTRPLEASGR